MIALLFIVKMVSKLAGVWPVATAFGIARRDRNYVTLLMATGLTFGSISALYGLNHGLVNRAQYSQLLTVVILSAVIPTLIAQRLFQPSTVDAEEEEALGAEDASIVHRAPVGPRSAAADPAGPAARPGGASILRAAGASRGRPSVCPASAPPSAGYPDLT